MDLISEILGCFFFLDLYKQITDNSCGYLHSLFLPNSNKCFLYVYLPYMHYLVLTLLATRHFTIYNVWFDFITSFSTFGQAKTFFNYHILMNIIVYMRFIL